MSRGHASSEEVSFVGTMPSIHLRPDASEGATGCEGAATPYCPPMEGVSILAHTCASEEALAERAIENVKRDAEWNHWFPPN